MKKLLTIIGVSILASFAVDAKYATLQTPSDFQRSVETEAITICYYRPKVWMGPGQRGFSITHEGHTSCDEQYNFGVLYYINHTYR